MTNARSGNPNRDGVRKAAIVVVSLGHSGADALLEQFAPEQAARIRQEIMELGDVDPQEQQRVLEEFCRLGPLMPKEHAPGIELSDRLARQLGPRQLRSDSAEPPAADGPPFQFLQDAETDKLARVLARERPQTIALILAHLPARQAGAVLVRLAAAQQVEVIRRLVELEETDAEILREVERGLQERLRQQVHMQRPRVAGPSAVAEILQASDSQVALRILDNLAAADPPLAEKLGPPPLRFEELANLDDDALAVLFRAAGRDLIVPALIGAQPELAQRCLGLLAAAEAAVVREQLEQPGPIRLRDVEDAQQQVAEIARCLLLQGRIRLDEDLLLPAAAH